jgi:hypothetical protein
MDVMSSVVSHISDRPSDLSISMDTLQDDKPYTVSSWIIPRLCSLLFIGLLVYWILTEQNGFSETMPSMINPSINSSANGYIGYHAIGLSIWAVVCNQETIMAFGIPLCCSSSYKIRKITHILFQVIGFLCGLGGMIAMLWYKSSNVSTSIYGTSFTLMNDNYYIPYSPHAWSGIAFLIGWLSQCIGRCIPYITPARHRFLGRLTYVTGLLCCCLGLQQQQTRQLLLTQLSFTNSTLTNNTISHWWFSQPSLGVILLGITGATTFLYGLL